VYRWQLTMALSILHRVSGILLGIGTLVLTCWLLAVAAGPETYASVRALMASVPGQILLVVWSFAFFLHFSNGIRHLLWDTGLGFAVPTAHRSAWAVVLATVLLTALTWAMVWAGGGP
jgi:succinate dehydrogenase / fumarate reductase cytochrome b subunit